MHPRCNRQSPLGLCKESPLGPANKRRWHPRALVRTHKSVFEHTRRVFEHRGPCSNTKTLCSNKPAVVRTKNALFEHHQNSRMSRGILPRGACSNKGKFVRTTNASVRTKGPVFEHQKVCSNTIRECGAHGRNKRRWKLSRLRPAMCAARPQGQAPEAGAHPRDVGKGCQPAMSSLRLRQSTSGAHANPPKDIQPSRRNPPSPQQQPPEKRMAHPGVGEHMPRVALAMRPPGQGPPHNWSASATTAVGQPDSPSVTPLTADIGPRHNTKVVCASEYRWAPANPATQVPTIPGRPPDTVRSKRRVKKQVDAHL